MEIYTFKLSKKFVNAKDEIENIANGIIPKPNFRIDELDDMYEFTFYFINSDEKQKIAQIMKDNGLNLWGGTNRF